MSWLRGMQSDMHEGAMCFQCMERVGQGNCQGLCNRFRTVQKNAECGEAPCAGPLFETKVCPTNCEEPQECQLGDWELWGNCMGTHSQTYRTRPIIKMPHNGGSNAACIANGGNISETKPCLEKLSPLDCVMTDWSMWTECTKTCGTGWKLRKRHISRPAMAGGKACDSNAPEERGGLTGGMREIAKCSPEICPASNVDCVFEDWTPWSSCREDGQRVRDRGILTPATSTGQACVGNTTEVAPCEKQHCQLSAWTDWSACDKPCDGGQRARHRQIEKLPRYGGEPCPLPLDTWEIEGCNTDGCHPSSDCQIGPWSTWGECSVTCGYGQSKRLRTVIQLRKALGQGCADPVEEVRKCMPRSCPGSENCHYQQWGAWSACNRTCGGGLQSRERGFLYTGGVGGAACHSNENMREMQGCNLQTCEANCDSAKWGDWSVWSACPITCGGGLVSRSRSKGQTAVDCGVDLSGPDKEFKTCAPAHCVGDLDCVFGAWGAWGACSASCNGVMKISRAVAIEATGNGKVCDGPLEVVAPCHPMPNENPPTGCGTVSAAVDCQWSSWNSTACSLPCGGGALTRTRTMTPAQNGGKPCNGTITEAGSCNTQACPDGDDCVWNDWNDWGACDKCGGKRIRTRDVKVPAAAGGKQCPQEDTEEVGECSRNCHGEQFCVWTDWTTWSTCSATCGNGRQNRMRQLSLSPTKPFPEIPRDTYLEQQWEAFRLEMTARRDQHKQDLAAAFAGGIISFVILASAVRLWPRGTSEPRYSTVSSEAPLE